MDSVSRFLAAAGGQPVDRPPVWMMRQAGRTLPEYRALKERHSFWELCRSPELAAIVTRQPLARFEQLDAAIFFSDILVVPAAMGVPIDFLPAPRLASLVVDECDVRRLVEPDVERELGFVRDGLRQVVAELGGRKAVIGFAGAPFTLACYLIDGGSAKGFVKTRAFAHQRPVLFQELLGRLTAVVGDYLEMQLAAGADAFQLFDTWAGEAGPELFERFLLPSLNSLFQRLQSRGRPGIYYVNGIGPLLEQAHLTGAAVIGADWRVPLDEVRRRCGGERVVQGNLDPAALFGPPAEIAAAVRRMIGLTGGRGHIVNLGHGLPPEAPLTGIAAFLEAVAGWGG